MTDFLTALKAAHEKAAPGPWVGAGRVSRPPGMDGSQMRADSDLATLLRNAAPEIIALVEAADEVMVTWTDALNAMDDDNHIPVDQWKAWMQAHCDLNEALDALEDSLRPRQGAAVSKEVVYAPGSEQPEWGNEYLVAEVWWCGDDDCDCSQAQINRIVPNLDAGRPWIERIGVWEGPFYCWTAQEAAGYAERDMEQQLAEMEANGFKVVREMQP